MTTNLAITSYRPYKLPAGIDTKKLAAALEAVVKAHPALNSRIVLENGTPRFEEAPSGEWKTGFEKVESIDEVRKDFGRPMDLLSEPLCKAVIWHTDAGDYLYLDFHHIVFDGLSISIFLKELDKAYRGEAPEAEKTRMRYRRGCNRKDKYGSNSSTRREVACRG